jgi:hypothetical protein
VRQRLAAAFHSHAAALTVTNSILPRNEKRRLIAAALHMDYSTIV